MDAGDWQRHKLGEVLEFVVVGGQISLNELHRLHHAGSQRPLWRDVHKQQEHNGNANTQQQPPFGSIWRICQPACGWVREENNRMAVWAVLNWHKTKVVGSLTSRERAYTCTHTHTRSARVGLQRPALLPADAASRLSSVTSDSPILHPPRPPNQLLCSSPVSSSFFAGTFFYFSPSCHLSLPSSGSSCLVSSHFPRSNLTAIIVLKIVVWLFGHSMCFID